MKIFSANDPIEEAVEAFIDDGLAVFDSTTTFAERFKEQIIESLESQTLDEEMKPELGFCKIPDKGYFYYVYDSNRFTHEESRMIVDKFYTANNL